jgi:DNA-binding Lrp family transcriptional regulator
MLSLLHHTIQSEIQADPEASNRAIGRRLGISHNTVLKVRRAMVA